jgi:hypothetical protein
LWELNQELDALGVSVVMVTFESINSADGYAKDSGMDWPILIDEQRYLYESYQMHRAGFWDIWGPKTWWAYGEQFMKGNFPERTKGDIHQRGGDVLIDGQGHIMLHHVGTGPADRPSVEFMIEIVKKGGK